jgi:hypothetical protein
MTPVLPTRALCFEHIALGEGTGNFRSVESLQGFH